MMNSQTPIDSLPNELLIEILSPFPTCDLLPLAAVSRHFYSIILRILQQRLIRATSLPDHRLILECYHPSAKLSTPYLHCDYLHTDKALYSEDEEEARTSGGSLSNLRQAYSHFRPVVQEENKRPRARYPPRVAQQQQPPSANHGDNDAAAASSSSSSPPKWKLETAPSLDIFLDGDEMFSQLCTVTNLVKTGPKPGLFLSHVNVSDGLIRVKRDWLAARAKPAAANGDEEEGVLWADAAHTVGVRFRVQENTGIDRPVLVAEGEEIPVAYRLEYEELLVRTSKLLMMVEKSEDQEIATEGKAIVIASI
ncbi:hypothetical protein QBC44DRAFT_156776 [Cladorrhinum sp. PSN332]|nr:hypothetical protein QBC44DRAFT_156776 [Cladorrhinum sp. PSN332]